MTFDNWVAQAEAGVPRYQRIYNAWYKHDNSEQEWKMFYFMLQKIWTEAQNDVTGTPFCENCAIRDR